MRQSPRRPIGDTQAFNSTEAAHPSTTRAEHSFTSHSTKPDDLHGPFPAFEVPGKELADGVHLVIVTTLREASEFDAQIFKPWRMLGQEDMTRLDPG